MNLDPLIAAQIEGRLIRQSYLLYIGATTPVRAWNGVGRLPLAAWGQDETGADYLGLGTIVDIPALQQLINGVAQRLDISLSGVDATVANLADEGADEIRAASVTIGLLFMDEDWQPLASPLAIWNGEADVIKSDSVSNPGGGKFRTVTLSTGSATTGRRRPRFNYFTRAQQRSRSEDDAFCDIVANYSTESEIKWPP